MRHNSDSQALQAASAPGVCGPVLLTAGLHVALLASYVAAYGGDWSALVCVDEHRIGRWPYEAIHIGFPASGYDGQFYYVLARDPWTRHGRQYIDFPPYRHVRIAYPALAWLGSGGDAELLLGVMPALNLAAIIGLAWLGARLAMYYRRSPWWGCLLPLAVNAGSPALRNLTDPVATAALCALLAAYWLDWPAWQLGFWAGVAAFSREQNVAIIVLVLGEALLGRCWSRVQALTVALFLWLGWVVTLRASYGEWPVAAGMLSAPLSGIYYCMTHLTGQYGRPAIINMVGMLLLAAQLGMSVVLLVARGQRLTAAVTWAGAGLLLVGGIPIYQSPWSYGRVFLWMPLGIWVWSMQSGRRWPAMLLSASVCWPLLAAMQPWIR